MRSTKKAFFVKLCENGSWREELGAASASSSGGGGSGLHQQLAVNDIAPRDEIAKGTSRPIFLPGEVLYTLELLITSIDIRTQLKIGRHLSQQFYFVAAALIYFSYYTGIFIYLDALKSLRIRMLWLPLFDITAVVGNMYLRMYIFSYMRQCRYSIHRYRQVVNK